MRRRLRLLYHWVRRRPRLLSRRCGLHAAPRISSETPPGTKASPPAFKGGRSPGRTTDLLGNTTGYAGVSLANGLAQIANTLQRKKERVIYAPEIVIYCRPFTLVLLSVFSQSSLSVLSVFTAFCPTPYIPAIYSHLLPPC